MNILLIERYSQLIQDLIQDIDDILRAVLSDDKLRQEIKYEWYSDETNIDWDALLKKPKQTVMFLTSLFIPIITSMSNCCCELCFIY